MSMKPIRIHIFGASGSGTTTLGKALSEKFNIKAFDFDNYYWLNTDIPYTIQRKREERYQLLLEDIKGLDSFIISGHYGLSFEPIDSVLTHAVFLYASADIRQERLRKREYIEFGDRMLEGGDMHKSCMEFIEWAGHYDDNDRAGRKLITHQKRIELLNCPVISIEGNITVDEIVISVIKAINIK